MFDDFKTYFFGNVWASFKQYQKTKRSVKADMLTDFRDGMAASVALYHLREHLPPSKSQSYASLIHKCPDYKLLGDIVNTSKHGDITQNINKALISVSKDIFQTIDSTIYKDKKGHYTSGEKNVVVQLNDGTERNLYDILTNIMNMWLHLLCQMDLINYVKPITLSKRLPKRPTGNQKLNIVAVKGLQWPYAFRIFRYDYDVKAKIPESDYKMEMNIYKQEYIVDLTFKKNNNSEEHTFQIPISEEQLQKLKKMKHDNQRTNFLVGIGADQGIFKKELKDGKESITVQLNRK